MGLFRKKAKPKEGAVKTVNGIHYAYRGGKWVKMSDKAQAQINKNDALNRANVGGTHTLTNKNQPKANNNQSNQTKNNKKNNSEKKSDKDGNVTLNGKTYNLNNRAELTAYNKALKASKSKNTNKSSNRDKISPNNKSNKPSSTVHTRHYKTGERLGVMTRSQRRNYDKEAAGRTFEGEVAKHEKSSGHGKSHLRETKYKASVRKGKTTNGSNNRKNLTIKEQHKIKLNEQVQRTAEQMQGDPRYKGPTFKKKKR